MKFLAHLILGGAAHAHVDDLHEILDLLNKKFIKEYCAPGAELMTYEVLPAGLTHYYKDHTHE